MPGSSEERYIRLEGGLLHITFRIPAGIYISVDIDSRRRWKTAIKVLSSYKYVVWGDIVTLSSYASPAFSGEIRVSYEAHRMLGSGDVTGELQTSLDELLDHGDESFELSFPPVCGIHPSLTLKATVVHACDDQDGALFRSLVDCEIARDTDAGHAQFAKYTTSKTVSHFNDAVQYFQLALDQTALTNLAYARLEGYIRNDIQDADTTTSLFREALALRPQGHSDHALSLYNLIRSLNWHYSKEPTDIYIHETARLCCKLLPLCPEGTYLRSIGVDSAVDYVIGKCNNLPTDTSDEGIHLRRNVLELCPVGQHRPKALDKLSWALKSCFTQCGNIDDLDESIQFGREAVSLCPEGHSDRDVYLNNLAISLELRFSHQEKPNDLDEAVSLHEEALRLRPVGHKYRHSSLGNLGGTLVTCFNRHGDINVITRAINLYHDALTLHPSRRGTTLTLALKTRYDKLHVNEDLNEAIDLSRESLQLTPLGDPERHVNLFNLSSTLCSRFTHEDIEEAINLCQESLAALHCTQTGISSTCGCRKQNFRLASGYRTQGFPWRISEAIDWARQAEVYESALEAYQMCFELFDSHVMTRSSIISRREAASAFRSAQSPPVDAASCAIRSGNPRRAVELVEQGRGQQWSLASRLRTPLEDLESTSPRLAQRLPTDRVAADRAATEYRGLSKQWEAAIAEIRNLQDFSRFLLPLSFTDLQAAARHGPVIILIASQYSCSAIIIPTSGEPHQVRFLCITFPDLEKLKDDFAMAIRHTARMRSEEPRKTLRVLLQMVWDEIMLPIVNVLQYDLQLTLHFATYTRCHCQGECVILALSPWRTMSQRDCARGASTVAM
ncbi:hypothetical protein DFJ58DRAFT_881389 [Suillus subalutaceus]|uniref:uncharacterized protein n=1 Tax=Suillus subalutaceus TaxID=48586 RepID=UPI001B868507|nr:uncharacterized protein DFJ58DRAFT_881389 [Suillus subalutaceus]KAG1873529.1 hypothetical protein DFJ58DRAFT_881389 [Suillus subalutaceus]